MTWQFSKVLSHITSLTMTSSESLEFTKARWSLRSNNYGCGLRGLWEQRNLDSSMGNGILYRSFPFLRALPSSRLDQKGWSKVYQNIETKNQPSRITDKDTERPGEEESVCVYNDGVNPKGWRPGLMEGWINHRRAGRAKMPQRKRGDRDERGWT